MRSKTRSSEAEKTLGQTNQCTKSRLVSKQCATLLYFENPIYSQLFSQK